MYIAEGEIEESFSSFLKTQSFISFGRFFKFNLLQDVLKKQSTLLAAKVDKIFCILDTDCLSDKFLKNLIENINLLKSISRNKIGLLIQNQNFEDELKYVLCQSDLGKFFNLKNKTNADVKRYLSNKVDYRQYISCENLIRYCSRPQVFNQELEKRKFKLIKSFTKK